MMTAIFKAQLILWLESHPDEAETYRVKGKIPDEVILQCLDDVDADPRTGWVAVNAQQALSEYNCKPNNDRMLAQIEREADDLNKRLKTMIARQLRLMIADAKRNRD